MNSYSKKAAFKIVASALLLSFAAQDVSWAAPVESASAMLLSQVPSSIQIPDAYGRVKEFHHGESPRFLIHIQDAHTNGSAQKNIAMILEDLTERYHIQTVFIEGGTKDDSLAFLRPLADAEQRTRVANKYLMKGEISGAEYLTLVSDRAPNLQGVEDLPIYLKNVEQYAEISSKRAGIFNSLSEIEKRVDSLKNNIYQPVILELDRFIAAYRNGDKSLTEFYSRLEILSKQTGTNLLGYPNFLSLSELKKTEASIDFKKANEEQSRILHLLGDKAKALEAFQDPKALKKSSKNLLPLYMELSKISDESKVDPASYPNISRYITYLKKYEAIDLDELVHETDALQGEIYGKSLGGNDAIRLYEIDTYLMKLRNLFSLQASKSDFTAFSETLDDTQFHMVSIVAFLNQKLLEAGKDADVLIYDPTLEASKQGVADFYRTTAERDDVMIRKTFDAMDRNKQNAAILITGGYHTENLKELFHQAKISYAVVSPYVKNETNIKRYEQILLSCLDSKNHPKPKLVTAGEPKFVNPMAAVEKNPGPIEMIRADLVDLGMGARLADEKPKKPRQKKSTLFSKKWILEHENQLEVRVGKDADLEAIWTIQKNSPANSNIWLSRDEMQGLLASGQVLVADATVGGQSIIAGAVFTSLSNGQDSYADVKNPEKNNLQGKYLYDFWIVANNDKELKNSVPGIPDKLIAASKEKGDLSGKIVVAYSRASGAFNSLNEREREDETVLGNPSYRAKRILRHLFITASPEDKRGELEPFIEWLASKHHVTMKDGSAFSMKLDQIVNAVPEDTAWNPAEEDKFVKLIGLLLRQFSNETGRLPVDATLGRLHMRLGAFVHKILIDSRPADTEALGANVEMSYENIPDLAGEIDQLMKQQSQTGAATEALLPVKQKPVLSTDERKIVEAISESFNDMWNEYKSLTDRAANHFEKRDWGSTISDAQARMSLYSKYLNEVERKIDGIQPILGLSESDWARIKEEYIRTSGHRYKRDLMLIYFYSVMRRPMSKKGISVQYSDDGLSDERNPERLRELVRAFESSNHTFSFSGFVQEMLKGYNFGSAAFENSERDAKLATRLMIKRLKGTKVQKIEMLKPVFYRNKGAYLIGRITTVDNRWLPIAFPLVHRETGIRVDSVLIGEDANPIFSSTRANFHVRTESYREMVDLLASMFPRLDRTMLYTAIGYIHPGKLDLVRSLNEYLKKHPDQKFIQTEGVKGTVMVTFTLPDFHYVFKVIRDEVPFYVKESFESPEKVMVQYEKVHQMDRVGRMLDPITFHNLQLPKSAFPEWLLETLQKETPARISIDGETVILKQVYTQRRVIPLDVYLDDASISEAEKVRVLVDLGYLVKDLNAANIFVGDYLLKNFGVTGFGKTVLYDYDDLDKLENWNFRDLPEGSSENIYFGERDAFPQMINTVLFPSKYQPVIQKYHPELSQPMYWNKVKSDIQKGEVSDFFPYPYGRRFEVIYPNAYKGSRKKTVAPLAEGKIRRYVDVFSSLRILMELVQTEETPLVPLKQALDELRNILIIAGISSKEAEAGRIKRLADLGGYSEKRILEGEDVDGVYAPETNPRLVRDKTITKREVEGKKPKWHFATDEEYGRTLFDKTDEEVREFEEALLADQPKNKLIERAANVKDVLLALTDYLEKRPDAGQKTTPLSGARLAQANSNHRYKFDSWIPAAVREKILTIVESQYLTKVPAARELYIAVAYESGMDPYTVRWLKGEIPGKSRQSYFQYKEGDRTKTIYFMHDGTLTQKKQYMIQTLKRVRQAFAEDLERQWEEARKKDEKSGSRSYNERLKVFKKILSVYHDTMQLLHIRNLVAEAPTQIYSVQIGTQKDKPVIRKIKFNRDRTIQVQTTDQSWRTIERPAEDRAIDREIRQAQHVLDSEMRMVRKYADNITDLNGVIGHVQALESMFFSKLIKLKQSSKKVSADSVILRRIVKELKNDVETLEDISDEMDGVLLEQRKLIRELIERAAAMMEEEGASTAGAIQQLTNAIKLMDSEIQRLNEIILSVQSKKTALENRRAYLDNQNGARLAQPLSAVKKIEKIRSILNDKYTSQNILGVVWATNSQWSEHLVVVVGSSVDDQFTEDVNLFMGRVLDEISLTKNIFVDTAIEVGNPHDRSVEFLFAPNLQQPAMIPWKNFDPTQPILSDWSVIGRTPQEDLYLNNHIQNRIDSIAGARLATSGQKKMKRSFEERIDDRIMRAIPRMLERGSYPIYKKDLQRTLRISSFVLRDRLKKNLEVREAYRMWMGVGGAVRYAIIQMRHEGKSSGSLQEISKKAKVHHNSLTAYRRNSPVKTLIEDFVGSHNGAQRRVVERDFLQSIKRVKKRLEINEVPYEGVRNAVVSESGYNQSTFFNYRKREDHPAVAEAFEDLMETAKKINTSKQGARLAGRGVDLSRVPVIDQVLKNFPAIDRKVLEREKTSSGVINRLRVYLFDRLNQIQKEKIGASSSGKNYQELFVTQVGELRALASTAGVIPKDFQRSKGKSRRERLLEIVDEMKQIYDQALVDYGVAEKDLSETKTSNQHLVFPGPYDTEALYHQIQIFTKDHVLASITLQLPREGREGFQEYRYSTKENDTLESIQALLKKQGGVKFMVRYENGPRMIITAKNPADKLSAGARLSSDQKILQVLTLLTEKLDRGEIYSITQKLIAQYAGIDAATVRNRIGANPEIKKAVEAALASDLFPSDRRIIHALKELENKKIDYVTFKAISEESGVNPSTISERVNLNPVVAQALKELVTLVVPRTDKRIIETAEQMMRERRDDFNLHTISGEAQIRFVVLNERISKNGQVRKIVEDLFATKFDRIDSYILEAVRHLENQLTQGNIRRIHLRTIVRKAGVTLDALRASMVRNPKVHEAVQRAVALDGTDLRIVRVSKELLEDFKQGKIPIVRKEQIAVRVGINMPTLSQREKLNQNVANAVNEAMSSSDTDSRIISAVEVLRQGFEKGEITEITKKMIAERAGVNVSTLDLSTRSAAANEAIDQVTGDNGLDLRIFKGIGNIEKQLQAGQISKTSIRALERESGVNDRVITRRLTENPHLKEAYERIAPSSYTDADLKILQAVTQIIEDGRRRVVTKGTLAKIAGLNRHTIDSRSRENKAVKKALNQVLNSHTLTQSDIFILNTIDLLLAQGIRPITHDLVAKIAGIDPSVLSKRKQVNRDVKKALQAAAQSNPSFSSIKTVLDSKKSSLSHVTDAVLQNAVAFQKLLDYFGLKPEELDRHETYRLVMPSEKMVDDFYWHVRKVTLFTKDGKEFSFALKIHDAMTGLDLAKSKLKQDRLRTNRILDKEPGLIPEMIYEGIISSKGQNFAIELIEWVPMDGRLRNDVLLAEKLMRYWQASSEIPSQRFLPDFYRPGGVHFFRNASSEINLKILESESYQPLPSEEKMLSAVSDIVKNDPAVKMALGRLQNKLNGRVSSGARLAVTEMSIAKKLEALAKRKSLKGRRPSAVAIALLIPYQEFKEYLVAHPEEIGRYGMTEGYLWSSEEKILKAVDEIRKEGTVRIRSTLIAEKAGLSTGTLFAAMKRNADVKKAVHAIMSREYRVRMALNRMREKRIPVSQMSLARQIGVHYNAVTRYKKNPVIKKMVDEARAGRWDTIILSGAESLRKDGVRPSGLNLEQVTGLSASTITTKMKNNPALKAAVDGKNPQVGGDPEDIQALGSRLAIALSAKRFTEKITAPLLLAASSVALFTFNPGSSAAAAELTVSEVTDFENIAGGQILFNGSVPLVRSDRKEELAKNGSGVTLAIAAEKMKLLAVQRAIPTDLLKSPHHVNIEIPMTFLSNKENLGEYWAEAENTILSIAYLHSAVYGKNTTFYIPIDSNTPAAFKSILETLIKPYGSFIFLSQAPRDKNRGVTVRFISTAKQIQLSSDGTIHLPGEPPIDALLGRAPLYLAIAFGKLLVKDVGEFDSNIPVADFRDELVDGFNTLSAEPASKEEVRDISTGKADWTVFVKHRLLPSVQKILNQIGILANLKRQLLIAA